MTEAATEASRQRVILCALVVGVLAYTATQSLTVPTLPRIEAELGATQANASWVLTSFLVSSSVATPILGRLGDSRGKRRMMLVCLGSLFVGSLMAALANSLEAMIVARVVQGIGGGALPLAFGIIRDEMAPDRVPRAVGFVSSLFAVGFALGMVLAGPLVGLLGYHGLFLVPMAVAGASALAVVLVVPESTTRSDEGVPLVPAFALAGWLTSSLLAISKAPQWGWTSPRVLVLGAIGAVLLWVWVWAERRAEYPLIDLSLMRLRGVWTTNGVALAMGAVMYGALAFMPQFSQTPASVGYGFGATATESGRLLVPMSAASFVSGWGAAGIARRVGERAVIVGCASIGTLGLLMLAVAHSSPWNVVVAMCLLGIATGGVFASLAVVLLDSVPQSRTGVATGMNANIRTVGGAIGSALAITLITSGPETAGYPRESGYTAALFVLTAAGIAALVVAAFIPSRDKRTADNAPSPHPSPADRSYGRTLHLREANDMSTEIKQNTDQWPATGGPPLHGTVAWIVGVGAVEGTGGALARRYAREGLHVVVSGRTEAKLLAVVADIEARGGRATAVVADATSEASLLAALTHIDAMERLGVTVYNAGGAQSRPSMLEMDASFVEDVWRINCLGGFVVGREAARRMAGAGGVIVFTGSKSSEIARPKQAAYAVAKFGLLAVSEALAREFSSQNVHVATVIPDGPIDGERMRLAFPDAEAVRGPDSMIDIEAIAEAYWQLTVQGRSAWTHRMDLRPWSER